MAESDVDKLRLEVLVLRSQAGEAAAFGRLAELYDGPAQYYVRRLLGGAQDAEDIVQEVWVSVAQQLSTLRNPASFAPWFYRIARNKVIGLIRERTRVPETTVEPAEDVADPHSAEDTFLPEDAKKIHTALEVLPLAQREVLVLRFLENMSYDEIAEVTGCTVGTVRSRLFYGKQALRRAMEPKS